MAVSKRKLEITWKELEEILRKSSKMLEQERIGEITFVRPKVLYIYTEEEPTK